MRNIVFTKSYVIILMLLASAMFAVLLIRNEIKLRNAAAAGDTLIRDWREYRRQEEQAKVLLRAGNRPGAIALLENAIASARAQRVLTSELALPSEGESLLMQLYEEDTRLGRPHREMKQLEECLRSTYPGFPIELIKESGAIKSATEKKK